MRGLTGTAGDAIGSWNGWSGGGGLAGAERGLRSSALKRRTRCWASGGSRSPGDGAKCFIAHEKGCAEPPKVSTTPATEPFPRSALELELLLPTWRSRYQNRSNGFTFACPIVGQLTRADTRDRRQSSAPASSPDSLGSDRSTSSYCSLFVKG